MEESRLLQPDPDNFHDSRIIDFDEIMRASGIFQNLNGVVIYLL